MSDKRWLLYRVVVWSSFLVVSWLLYYVHHSLPEGPLYPTGEYVCQNDDRGPCREDYIEDVRDLDIPSWAKFFKKSEGELLWMGLFFVSIMLVEKPDKKKKKDRSTDAT